MAERTTLPFAVTLRELMDARGLGSARVGHLVAGSGHPTVENLILLAAALGVEPEVFAEYREHVVLERARRLVELHGADVVLDKLDELD